MQIYVCLHPQIESDANAGVRSIESRVRLGLLLAGGCGAERTSVCA